MCQPLKTICEGILLSNKKRPDEIPSWWENRRGESAGQGDLGLNLNKNLEDLPRGQSKKEMLEIHEDHPLQNNNLFENDDRTREEVTNVWVFLPFIGTY